MHVHAFDVGRSHRILTFNPIDDILKMPELINNNLTALFYLNFGGSLHMAFTTQTFIFLFFPICAAIYYFSILLQSKGILAGFLKKYRLSDLALIGISSCFYLWACFDDLFRFAMYIFLVYFLGVIIHKVRAKDICFAVEHRENAKNKRYISFALPVLCIAIFVIVYILIHFKYTHLLADIWNILFKDNIAGKSVLAPLGISFITFSAISYLADIYNGKASPGNIIDCALYLTFFPKVVSGPIVLWRDFSHQIPERRISLNLISDGVSRIMIGFAKKLILADTFGNCIASAGNAIDVPTAWGIALLYMLQIYYDFSGYSDIAIGLSNILGFKLKENFNFPYLSCSITEFWRRWHISLGTWFREYIYFPLGGSRHGKKRTILNIAIVFLLTGIWHGAGLTYMLWGIINGVCNIIEKQVSDKIWYKKIPKGIKWITTMGITYFCWEIFRFNSFSDCIEWFKVMFGQGNASGLPFWSYYFDTRMIIFMALAVVGATLFGLPKVQNIYKRFIQKPYGYLIYQLILIGLFSISILFMVNSTYSPFIYFQY